METLGLGNLSVLSVLSVLPLHIGHDGLSDRVLGTRFRDRCRVEDRLHRYATPWHDRLPLRFAEGACARLVEDDRIDPPQGLEIETALDDDAASGRATNAAQYRGRSSAYSF
jgi:hypothetical protein